MLKPYTDGYKVKIRNFFGEIEDGWIIITLIPTDEDKYKVVKPEEGIPFEDWKTKVITFTDILDLNGFKQKATKHNFSVEGLDGIIEELEKEKSSIFKDLMFKKEREDIAKELREKIMRIL